MNSAWKKVIEDNKKMLTVIQKFKKQLLESRK